MSDAFFGWLLTYLLHSTILLGLAWLLEHLALLRTPQLRELVWRIALFGGLLTATLQAPLHAAFSHSPPAAAIGMPHGAPGMPVPPFRPATSGDGAAAIAHPRSPPELPTISIPSVLGTAGSLIVAPWLLLVALGWLHTLRGARRLNAAARDCLLSRDPELLSFLNGIAQRKGRRPPALRLTERWGSPLVVPNGDICIPQWTMDQLTPIQRQLMLAHELAHVCRRDPAWRIATQLAAHIGFFQPLNGLALRRLELSAELACDAWAADVAGHRHALAETLLACAEALQAPRFPALALGMAHKRSPLFIRITSLMEERPMLQRPGIRHLSQLVAAAFAGLVITLPLLAVGVDKVDQHTTVALKQLALNASIDGPIQLTEQEDDVSRIGHKASFAQTVAGKQLRIVYKNDDHNGVTLDYTVDGTSRPLDAQGKAWVAQVIPTVLRESGLDADQRVKRLRAHGGAGAVLADMEKIHLGHSRARYVQALVASGQLTPQQMQQLRAIIGGIDTDPDRRDAYVAVLKHQSMSVAQLDTLLADVAKVRANEKCDILVAFAAAMPSDATLLQHYRDTAKTLPDQQRGRAEKALDHVKA